MTLDLKALRQQVQFAFNECLDEIANANQRAYNERDGIGVLNVDKNNIDAERCRVLAHDAIEAITAYLAALPPPAVAVGEVWEDAVKIAAEEMTVAIRRGASTLHAARVAIYAYNGAVAALVPPPPQGEPGSALGEAIEWIQKAPEGTWGYGTQEDGYGNIQQWPLRDELVSRLQAAFLAPQGEPVTEALAFYANERRYNYDNDCCPEKNNPGSKAAEEDLLQDRGERARAALNTLSAQPTAGWREGEVASKLREIAEGLEFNSRHIIAEDTIVDAFAMLEAAKGVMADYAAELRATLGPAPPPPANAGGKL